MAESSGDNHTVATLHVLEQSISKEQKISIRSGETSLGRGKENGIVLVKKGISKTHAAFLIEDGSHFIKDCGSKNSTYRKSVKLRPHAYYELVDRCTLTFGDLECQYLFNEPSSEPSSAEADYNKSTLPFTDDSASVGSGRPSLGVAETVSLASDNPEMPLNSVDAALKPPRPPTASTAVPGDAAPQGNGTARGAGEEVAVSPPTSPDLLGSPTFICPPPLAETNESACGGEDLPPQGEDSSFAAGTKQMLQLEEDTPEGRTVRRSGSAKEGCEDQGILQYSPPPIAGGGGGSKSPSVANAIPPTVPYTSNTVEPTVPYTSNTVEPTVPYSSNTVEPTVPYTSNTVEPTVPYTSNTVEPTVPYSSDSVDPTVPYSSDAVDPTVPYSSDAVEPTVPYITDTVPNSDRTVEDTVPYQSPLKEDQPSPIGQTVPYKMADKEDDETDIEDELPDVDLRLGSTSAAAADKTTARPTGVEKTGGVKSVEASPFATSLYRTPDTNVGKHSEEIPEQRGKQVSRPPAPSLGGAPPDTPEEDQVIQSSYLSDKRKTPALVAPESPPILDPYEFPSTSDNAADRNSPEPETVTTKVAKKRGRSRAKAASSKGGSENAEDVPDAKKKKQANPKTPTVRKVRSDKSAVSLAPVDDDENPEDEEQVLPVKQPKSAKAKAKTKGERSKAATPAVDRSIISHSPASSSTASGQDVNQVRVLFTGVEDKDSEKTIASIGGAMAKDVYECSHLVTDKMRRTMKFLCCLARGCHIVSFKWIEKCRQQRTFVDGQPFLLRDKAFEKQHDFNLVRSVDKARTGPAVLTGYRCFLSAGVKPNQQQLTDIIQCAGGKVLKVLPDSSPADDTTTVVIASEEEAGEYAEAEARGFPVYTTEFVFSAILKQELALSDNRLNCGGGGEEASSGQSAKTDTSSRSRKRQAEGSSSRSKRSKR